MVTKWLLGGYPGVTMVLLFGCQTVAIVLLSGSCGVIMVSQVVAMVLLCGCYGVARWLLGCC